MSDAPRTVAVVGGGVAAAMAVLAVARAFGPLGVKVTWLATGETMSRHLAYAAPPDLKAFHRLLRIEEGELLRTTAATLRTAEQFAGWSGDGGAFLHAYGDAGSAFRLLPFIQYWTRARRAGLRVALEDFCLAAAAAKQGRLRTEPGSPALNYGYHLDEVGYARLLSRECATAGVETLPGQVAAPRITDGVIQDVTLSDGERLTADLFIDADGILIDALDPDGAVAADPFCDRTIIASAPPLSPVPVYARAATHSAGYLSLLPLRDSTAIRFAYRSDHLSDEEATAALPSLTGMALLGREEPSSVAAHRRPRPWVGNCIAIGAAAGEPEPLDAAPMLSLQLAVGQLILLWPVRRDAMPEAAIYNDEIAGQQARIADFTAQHFRLNARTGELFWDDARARPVSPELQGKIDLFAARGKFAHGNHEAHVEDGWAMCMTGHGMVPASADLQADRVADDELMAEFQRQLRAVATEVGGMETHAAALARLARAAR